MTWADILLFGIYFAVASAALAWAMSYGRRTHKLTPLEESMIYCKWRDAMKKQKRDAKGRWVK